MNTKYCFAVICLLVASVLLIGCGPSEEELAAQTAVAVATETAVVQATEAVAATETAVVQATEVAVAVKATLVAMPLSSSELLYLGFEDNLSTESVQPGTSQHYLYGGSESFEWVMRLDNESLAESYTYNLVMASAGTSDVTVEIILKQDGQETVLGQDSFAVASTYYMPYQGQISSSETAVQAGDQFVLRLTISGDDFGITHGPSGSSVSLLKPTDLSAAVAEERIKALTWVATNNIWGLHSDIFTSFRDQLDSVISSGSDAKWGFGWGLCTSGKPYSLEWTNGIFDVEEISIEQAQEQDIKEESVIFEVSP